MAYPPMDKSCLSDPLMAFPEMNLSYLTPPLMGYPFNGTELFDLVVSSPSSVEFSVMLVLKNCNKGRDDLV